jgi:hypothetical protein
LEPDQPCRQLLDVQIQIEIGFPLGDWLVRAGANTPIFSVTNNLHKPNQWT